MMKRIGFGGIRNVKIINYLRKIIVRREDDGVVLKAEVFGDGIDMWMRSQGEMVEEV